MCRRFGEDERLREEEGGRRGGRGVGEGEIVVRKRCVGEGVGEDRRRWERLGRRWEKGGRGVREGERVVR